MTPADLVASLKTVPETRLRIIELAWELAASDGGLDETKAVPRMGEIRNACQEAGDYGAATKKLVGSLRTCLCGRW